MLRYNWHNGRHFDLGITSRPKKEQPSEISVDVNTLLQSLQTRVPPWSCWVNNIIYIKEADRHLENNLYYQKLWADPTARYTTKIKKFINLVFSRGLINKKTKNFLIPHHPRQRDSTYYQKFISLEIRVDPLWSPPVPQRKTFLDLLIYFCNPALPGFHPISGTLLTSLVNYGGYPHYQSDPFW